MAAFPGGAGGGATLGAIVPPDGYWPLVRDICDRHGVLLIADEVLTGFGRTGVWFAMERFQLEPDITAMAKGVTGGYFPLAIAAMRGADVKTVRRAHGDLNLRGTYSHHAVGAAAALAMMDYMEAHGLVPRAAGLGEMLAEYRFCGGDKLRAALRSTLCLRTGQAAFFAVEAAPGIGDVRGIGLQSTASAVLWAVELVAHRATKEPYPASMHLADRVCDRCMELGVLLYPGHGSADGVRGDHLIVAPRTSSPRINWTPSWRPCARRFWRSPLGPRRAR